MIVDQNPELYPLTEADFQSLQNRWIPRELAEGARLRRVTSLYGAELVGRTGKAGNYAGIAIPYFWPDSPADATLFRLRRDEPDLESKADGSKRQKAKYLSAPGSANRLYLSPQTELPHLTDVELPIVLTEGEFKTLALWRLAWHGLGDTAESPAFLPIGLSGVWNWRGTTGKDYAPDGSRVSVKGPIYDLSRLSWQDRRVIILFDADIDKIQRVADARRALTEELEGRGAQVAWFIWPASVPAAQKGIDDFLAANGPEHVIRLLSRAKTVTRKKRKPTSVAEAVAEDDPDWKRLLIRSDRGIKPILANAMTALREAPEWRGALAFNEFTMRTEVKEGTPWRRGETLWGDVDDILLTEWMQRKGVDIPKTAAADAAEAIAREHSYHPVRDYLDRLVWDRTPRIDTWLIDYYGAKDSEYIRAVGAKWLISAVARVMQPGCQADHTLIFEGEQGLGKSSSLRVLGGQWFTDQVDQLGSKDSAIQICGVWIVEFGELTQLVSKLSELEMIKSWLTRTTDHFRPPYGRRSADFPRQCVFAGSCNNETYLRDETGGRRFWPVRAARADVDGLRLVRDQLWAEARHRYDQGERWHITDKTVLAAAEEEQEARYQLDPWDTVVWDYTEGARAAYRISGNPVETFKIKIKEILEKAIKKDTEAWSRSDSNRIIAIMRRHGLVYRRERCFDADGEPVLGPDGKQQRDYFFAWPDPSNKSDT